MLPGRFWLCWRMPLASTSPAASRNCGALGRIRHLVGDPAAVHQHGGVRTRDAERDDDVDAGDLVEGAVAQDDLLAVIVRPAHRRSPQVSQRGVEGLA